MLMMMTKTMTIMIMINSVRGQRVRAYTLIDIRGVITPPPPRQREHFAPSRYRKLPHLQRRMQIDARAEYDCDAYRLQRRDLIIINTDGSGLLHISGLPRTFMIA